LFGFCAWIPQQVGDSSALTTQSPKEPQARDILSLSGKNANKVIPPSVEAMMMLGCGRGHPEAARWRTACAHSASATSWSWRRAPHSAVQRRHPGRGLRRQPGASTPGPGDRSDWPARGGRIASPSPAGSMGTALRPTPLGDDSPWPAARRDRGAGRCGPPARLG